MPDRTIALTDADDETLKGAAVASSKSEDELLRELVAKAIAALRKPSWQGELVLDTLSALRASPKQRFDMQRLFNLFLVHAPGNEVQVLWDGVDDLLAKGFVSGDQNRIELTEAGYLLVQSSG